jgi:hypothetical protein
MFQGNWRTPPLPRGSKSTVQRCWLCYAASCELSSLSWSPLFLLQRCTTFLSPCNLVTASIARFYCTGTQHCMASHSLHRSLSGCHLGIINCKIRIPTDRAKHHVLHNSFLTNTHTHMYQHSVLRHHKTSLCFVWKPSQPINIRVSLWWTDMKCSRLPPTNLQYLKILVIILTDLSQSVPKNSECWTWGSLYDDRQYIQLPHRNHHSTTFTWQCSTTLRCIFLVGSWFI